MHWLALEGGSKQLQPASIWQVESQPSSGTMLLSSHASPTLLTPSPQDRSQMPRTRVKPGTQSHVGGPPAALRQTSLATHGLSVTHSSMSMQLTPVPW